MSWVFPFLLQHRKMSPKGNLGKALIKNRFRGHNRTRDEDSFLVSIFQYFANCARWKFYAVLVQYTTDLDQKPDADWVKLQSITQENDLDAFLHKAELEETDFTAGKVFFYFKMNMPGVLNAHFLVDRATQCPNHQHDAETQPVFAVQRAGKRND